MPDIQIRYATQMAGEFYTAGEIFKKGFFASVSFGNAKSFDIVVFSKREDKFARIEVKSSKDPYYTRRHPPIYQNDHKFHFNIEALDKEIKTAKRGSNKFYVFVAVNGLNNKPDFYVFHVDTIHNVMRKKIKSVSPSKVRGRWDIKLSEIFDSSESQSDYQKKQDAGWKLLREYLK